MAGAPYKQAPQTLPSLGNGPRSIEQVKQTSTEGQRIKKVGAKNVGLADLAQQGAWFSAGDTQSAAQRIKLEGLGAKALADWRRWPNRTRAGTTDCGPEKSNEADPEADALVD